MQEDKTKIYKVKEMADIAKVSVRTLQYYDQIGLLKPERDSANGYRYYDDAAAIKLQQIRFYSDLGIKLKEIAQITTSDDFDIKLALRKHRAGLEQKQKRLIILIKTIDKTLLHMKGEKLLQTKQFFEGFDPAKQKEYEKEVELRWGNEKLMGSRKLWKSYSAKKQKQIISESNEIYVAFVPYIGQDVASDEVMALVSRWHENLGYYYEPTTEILLGLAQTYTQDYRFRTTFDKFDKRLADYLSKAIELYVKNL